MQAAQRHHRVVLRLPFAADTLALGRVLHAVQAGLQVAAQHDVGAAAGHVGGNGNRADLAGPGDDLRFLLVVLGVEHLVRDALFLEQPRHPLRGFDRRGADQHGLAAVVAILDVGQHGAVFLIHRQEYLVAHILARHRPVRGNDHHLQAVDRVQLEGFGVGGAGHAGQLVVQAKIILEGDGGEGLVFLLDRHLLLGFDRLVQALGPAPAGHQPPGEFIDDDDLAVVHHVVHVALEQRVGAQRGVQVVHQGDVGGVVQALALAQQAGLGQQVLGMLVAGVGQQHLAGLFVDLVVARSVGFRLPGQARDQRVDLGVKLRAALGRAGNDQRRARLVDENGVHLVDDAVTPALHAVGSRKGHVVAQVVETELVVGAVGDVGRVGRLTRRLVEVRHDDAGAQAQELVHLAHPVAVATGQVIVHRHDVHTAPGECVQVGRQRGDQGLALAGAHFGDLALVQHHAADQLHIEMAHAQHPAGRLAHQGEGFR